jgi:hypothetical protein
MDGEGRHRAIVQPKWAILALFYDQAQRIYSLTPATGAPDASGFVGAPVNADSADRRHGGRSSTMADILSGTPERV